MQSPLLRHIGRIAPSALPNLSNYLKYMNTIGMQVVHAASVNLTLVGSADSSILRLCRAATLLQFSNIRNALFPTGVE